MSDELVFHFDIDGEDFTSAGQASVQIKKNLRALGISPETIRRVSIAMYEGEINMVIHAGGGEADVIISEDCITIILADHGPGIKNIEQAMQEGFSTATDNVRSLGFGAGDFTVRELRAGDGGLDLRAGKRKNAVDYILFPTPEQPYSLMMSRESGILEVNFPAVKAAPGIPVIDARRILGEASMKTLEKYPAFESGYLILKKADRINYLEINAFVSAFLRQIGPRLSR